MSEHKITVAGGSSVRLPTAGKYCDRDIVVTAQGGGEGGGIVLPEVMSLELNAEIDAFTESDAVACVHAKTTEAIMLGEGAEVRLHLDTEVFGDAAPLDVMLRAKFTSKHGLNQMGGYTIHIPQRPIFTRPAATSSQVLVGTQVVNDNDKVVDGTMPNNGAVNANLSIGGSYTIPEGYHDGTGVVTGAALPTLDDPAAEEDVLLGKGFISEDGGERYGSLRPYAFTPGWEVMVPLRKTYDSSDVFLQMTSLSGFGNAAEEDVAAGKTFTNEQGVAKVGTAQVGGGGLETVNVTFTIYGNGTIYYMGANGIATLTSPYAETVEVVKNSPVIVWYEKYGGTYLINRVLEGGLYIYGNAGVVNGYSCDIITFSEDGSALYEEV